MPVQFPCPVCGGDPPRIAANAKCRVCEGLPYLPKDLRPSHEVFADSYPAWVWVVLLLAGLMSIGKAGCALIFQH